MQEGLENLTLIGYTEGKKSRGKQRVTYLMAKQGPQKIGVERCKKLFRATNDRKF